MDNDTFNKKSNKICYFQYVSTSYEKADTKLMESLDKAQVPTTDSEETPR